MSNGNMGIKQKDLKNNVSLSPVGVPSDDAKRKEQLDNEIKYPKFRLEDKHIEAAGLTGVSPDDVIECTLRCRVEGVKRKSKTSKEMYDSDHVELEIQNVSDVTMIDSAPEGEESDEDKDFNGRIGFAATGMKKGGGSIGPKAAGVKLK